MGKGTSSRKVLTAALLCAVLTLQLPPVVVAAAAAPTPEKVIPAALPPAVALEKPRSDAQALNGIAQQQATAADPAVGPQLPVSPSVVVDPGTSASPAVTAPILSATAPNLMQIVVTFGAPMSSHGATDVQDGAHYTLTSPGTSGLVIGAGQLATDGMTLTLTLSCASSPCQIPHATRASAAEAIVTRMKLRVVSLSPNPAILRRKRTSRATVPAMFTSDVDSGIPQVPNR